MDSIHEILALDSNSLSDIVGQYTPAFMQIKLAFPFDNDVSKLDNSQKGTLLHEYIHFLQNIATPFGILRSLLQYRKMVDMITYLQSLSAGETLHLPVSVPIEKSKEIEWKRHLLYSGGPSYQNLRKKAIAKNEAIVYRTKIVNFDQRDYSIILLNTMLSDGNRCDIILGGDIIMESMAAMCQHMIDPNSTHEGLDIPYNVVKIICQQHFPSLFNDEVKLIVLCYISLFSMNPGYELIRQLDYAEHNPGLSSEKLLSCFFSEINILQKGTEISTIDFFNGMVDDFKRILEEVIQQPLDYWGEALERVKISNDIPPFVAAFADGVMNDEKVKQLFGCYGIPYMYSEAGGYNYSESLLNPGQASNDMIALIGFHTLYGYMSSNNHRCPLYYLKCSSKPECKNTPWEGEPCTIQVMAQTLEIDKLKIAP